MNKASAQKIALAMVMLVPAFLYWLFTPGLRLSNSTQVLTVFSNMTAVSALSALAFSVILSARLKIFDTIFRGLDSMYRAHYLASAWAVLLVLVHSGLLIIKYSSISWISGYEFIKPTTEWPLLAGKLALFMMAALVVLVLYFNIRYQWFVLAMRVLGAVIFLAGYHALFITGGDLTKNPLLFWYMLFMGLMAMGVYIYRSLFHQPLNREYTYVVSAIEDRGGDIIEIALQPKIRPLQWYAGQFIFIRLADQAVPTEVHPFTISSNSAQDEILLDIKKSGDYTALLEHVSVGSLATIEGPFGSFTQHKITAKQQIWVAGGIGVTPFLAMARSLHKYPQRQVTLFYSVRTRQEAVFLQQLQAQAMHTQQLTVVPVFTQEDGLLTAEKIGSVCSIENVAILICGPGPMMKALRSQFVQFGIHNDHIYTEEFSL